MPDNDVNSYTAADFDFSHTLFGEKKRNSGGYTNDVHDTTVLNSDVLSLIFGDVVDSYSIVLSIGDTVSLKKQCDSGTIISGYVVRIKKLLIDNVYVIAVRIKEYPGIVFVLLPDALKEYPERKGQLFNCYDRISLEEILSKRYDNEKRQIKIDNKNQFENMRRIKCWYLREKDSVLDEETIYCHCGP